MSSERIAGGSSVRSGVAPTHFESLESRVMLSISFQFDYSLDTNGFFDSDSRRAVLEEAGERISMHLEDDLLSIVPGGPNTWVARFTHPGTGEAAFEVPNLIVPADTLIVYAGARSLGGPLGLGGAGGYSASGSQGWLNLVKGRGEPGALGPDDSQTDLAPWGGAITFDVGTKWHDQLSEDGLGTGKSDLLSVAMHELMHLIGFSTGTASFANLVVGSTFTGGEATDEYDGVGGPPVSNNSHWQEGVTDEGFEVLMDPSLTTGMRKTLTRLDLAALDDIGWDVSNYPEPPIAGTEVMLGSLTGDGEAMETLAGGGDERSFTFESVASGRGFVQVVSDGLLDAEVFIYDDHGVVVARDSAGHIGATADVETFIDRMGDSFSVLVVAESGSGTFTLRIDTEPPTHFKYYPEGFANNKISEFVSITNPNDFDVTYTITLRYEDPNLPVEETVVAKNVTIGPGLRSGVTPSDKGFLAPDVERPGQKVLKGTPYAIIVSSNGPLAASLSHFDFSIATGESFTDVTSTAWAFPRAERAPGDVNDFLVFYNPNDHQIEVTLTAFAPGGAPIELTQTVGAMRRSGWGFSFGIELPDGVYGVRVTSRAKDMANDDAHLGIVAALTHFDTVTGSGWGVLGDPTSGSEVGVFPGLTRREGGDIEIGFLNLDAVATRIVVVKATYIDADLPDKMLNVPVPASSSFFVTGAALGLVEGEAVGISYSTLVGGDVVAQAQETGFGDGTSTAASTTVGREFVFGDAFINSNSAGEKYFETLFLYNPDASALPLTIEILFNDGIMIETVVNVPAGAFGEVRLHEFQELLDHKQQNFFGIRVTADSPFAVTQSHFDLTFGSGWSAQGAPVGFTTELDAIV